MNLLILTAMTMNLHFVWGYTVESVFPDEDGTIITCNFNRTLDLDVSNMRVHFWDYDHNFYGNYSILNASKNINAYKYIDLDKMFKVYIPGFSSDINGNTAMWIRDAFQSSSEELFLVIIDYSTYTGVLTPEKLEEVVPSTYYMGDAVAQVLADLNTAGLSSQNIHLLGHSMGTHISGYVGDQYREKTGEYIERITAISPAGTCWPDANIEDQISADKAKYVETFHCTEIFSTNKTVSDVDFFYNYEMDYQPGCFDDTSEISTALCSHVECVRLWARTVTHPDWYGACRSYYEYVEGVCEEEAIAGYYNTGDVFGIFYVTTQNVDDDGDEDEDDN